MRGFKRLVAAAIAVLAFAWTAQAAITWTIVVPTDCASAGSPAECCISSNAASNTAACNRRMNYGDMWEVLATVSQASTGTYTGSGGDAIAAAQFKKLGLNTVVYVSCEQTTTGRSMQIVRGGTPVGTTLNVKLYDDACPATGAGCAAANEPCPCCTGAGAGATCNGPQELANSASVLAQNVRCLFYGY